MTPETRIKYATNHLIFSINNLQSHFNKSFLERIKWWWNLRKNRVPYWSNKIIANNAIHALEEVLKIIQPPRSKGDITKEGK